VPSEQVSEAGTPEGFLEAYQRALSTQDWEAVAPLVHQDCTVVFSSGTFVGFDEVESAFRRNFELIDDERYTISNLQWLDRSVDRAVALYDFVWEGLIGGAPASGGGRGTAVLARGEGGWQLLVEHLGPPARG
jgi:ketosteroid isomerase-like protein